MDVEYKPEAKAFERVGGTFMYLGTAPTIHDINNILRNKSAMLTDEQLLKYYLEREVIKLQDVIPIDPNVIQSIFEYIPLMKKPQYMNPTALIFGYLATKGGKYMDKTEMKQMMSYVDRLEEPGVTKPDIIRYARFWLNLNYDK